MYKSQACLSATFGQRGVDLILSPAAFDSRNPVVVVVVKFFVKLAISWQETHPKEIKSIKLKEQIYSYRADQMKLLWIERNIWIKSSFQIYRKLDLPA